MAQTQLKRSQDRKSAAISVPVNAPVVESRAAVPKKETSGKRWPTYWDLRERKQINIDIKLGTPTIYHDISIHIYIYPLAGGLEHEFYDFPYIYI